MFRQASKGCRLISHTHLILFTEPFQAIPNLAIISNFQQLLTYIFQKAMADMTSLLPLSDPQFHLLIQERVKFIIDYLQLDESSVLVTLPHLSYPEPFMYVFKSNFYFTLCSLFFCFHLTL